MVRFQFEGVSVKLDFLVEFEDEYKVSGIESRVIGVDLSLYV